MAITAFTGPPGAGKSHALVKDVIIPAVLSGRRVLSNIDGLDADAVLGYCLERVTDATKLGSVHVFHGDDALKPGFFPDETTPDSDTVVKGGDLLVFDEWALTFPRRGKSPPGCNVEAFLRWHRHLTRADGQATDVAIATQVPADVNINYRPLIARSYKFRKLTALGAEGTYSWLLFEGHLQPKGGHYRNGTGRYDPEVFPLYASSSAAKDGTHVELRTNKKDSIWSGWQPWAVVLGSPVLFIGGGYALWSIYSGFMDPAAAKSPETAQAAAAPVSGAPAAAAASPVPSSDWRIVGHIEGDYGTRVILGDAKGTTRIVGPEGFDFEEGRPVRGRLDGRAVTAQDTLPAPASSSPFGGVLQ